MNRGMKNTDTDIKMNNIILKQLFPALWIPLVRIYSSTGFWFITTSISMGACTLYICKITSSSRMDHYTLSASIILKETVLLLTFSLCIEVIMRHKAMFANVSSVFLQSRILNIYSNKCLCSEILLWQCRFFKTRLQDALIQSPGIKCSCLTALALVVPYTNLPNDICFHLPLLVSVIPD